MAMHTKMAFSVIATISALVGVGQCDTGDVLILGDRGTWDICPPQYRFDESCSAPQLGTNHWDAVKVVMPLARLASVEKDYISIGVIENYSWLYYTGNWKSHIHRGEINAGQTNYVIKISHEGQSAASRGTAPHLRYVELARAMSGKSCMVLTEAGYSGFASLTHKAAREGEPVLRYYLYMTENDFVACEVELLRDGFDMPTYIGTWVFVVEDGKVDHRAYSVSPDCALYTDHCVDQSGAYRIYIGLDGMQGVIHLPLSKLREQQKLVARYCSFLKN